MNAKIGAAGATERPHPNSDVMDTMKPPKQFRQSTQESAAQAEGIFDLYGESVDERRTTRHSVESMGLPYDRDSVHEHSGINSGHSGDASTTNGVDDQLEILSTSHPIDRITGRTSEISLETDRRTFRHAPGSIDFSAPRTIRDGVMNDGYPSENGSNGHDRSYRNGSGPSRTPVLTFTPDITPSKPRSDPARSDRVGTDSLSNSVSRNDRSDTSQEPSNHARLSILSSASTASYIPSRSTSPSASPSPSPVPHQLHPGTALSTRARGSIGNISNASAESSRIGDTSFQTYQGEADRSQVSVAGSTRYPGEEEDAFHVRSTYARLESEGVFGDGWDPGVERTRGGPIAGKRATMMETRRGSEVGDKEKSYLSSLDRYGFIREPLRDRNESRLALIPSSPFARIPKLPRSSPLKGKLPAPSSSITNANHPDPPSAATPSSSRSLHEDEQERIKKEMKRTEKWMKMMGVKRKEGGNAVEWGWKGDANGKLKRRVYKGIPDRWRMAAWWTLAEEANSRLSSPEKGKKKAVELESEYRHTIDLPSIHDVQIDLDVPRTISGHTLFVTRYGSGQRSLFHVLHSFSLLCETCGYCQGMGPIAATLLCYFDPERTYTLMVRLHDLYGMHDIFAPGFPGLLEAFYVQERLMEYLMPDVYQSFKANMISSSAWGTKWYITLFVNTVPFSTQLRIWDAMWLDGRDVMIITSIAVLWAFRDLLAHQHATFESILSLLSSHYVPEDEDAMLRWIKRMLHQDGMRERMDGWRKEWHALKAAGKDGDALL